MMVSTSPERLLRAVARPLSALALAGAVLLPAGCASGPDAASVASATRLFDDAQFGPPGEPVDAAAVFRVTPEMQRFIETNLLPVARTQSMRKVLTQALYDHDRLRLEYEASMTRNAGEAFAARSGNCLSLVIMTGAFAQALGMDVTYQTVVTDDMWSRAGGMYFMSGHVNLQVDRAVTDRIGHWDRSGAFTVDFMPSEDSANARVRAISERTVLAMYLNNRAAEALVQGHVADAYWRVRQALEADPAFLSAYNTLGIVYLRHGDAARADAAFRQVLDRTPDNPRVLANEVQALRALGRGGEAAQLGERLARVEPVAPFYYFNRGKAELDAGHFGAARAYFKQELARAPEYHEFHFWLAVADFELGMLAEAHSEMAAAMEGSVRRSDHDVYAAKLDKLKAWQAANVQ
jgi:Tfp pilus assembly protein PilF